MIIFIIIILSVYIINLNLSIHLSNYFRLMKTFSTCWKLLKVIPIISLLLTTCPILT